MHLTLLDTPGHVDFASQTEQVLSVLDYAILVVAAPDGVQGYTRTLWRLLERYHVPAFVFVNKMDTPGADKARVLADLQMQLSPGCIDFTADTAGALPDATQEEIALQDEALLDTYMTDSALAPAAIKAAINARQVTPVYFGAALKQAGVAELLDGLAQWTSAPVPATTAFGARVFKITHAVDGERLTWLRVVSGELKVKAVLEGVGKANQLRLYNGAKYTLAQNVPAGGVRAVTGLTETYPGQGLGVTPDAAPPLLTPVLTYAAAPQIADVHACLTALRELADEDPQLHVTWAEQLQEIHVQVLGPMQLEILQQMLKQRYGLTVTFDVGSILYRETVTESGVGIGHFEPLRHYAEVHLRLEPDAPGSGITIASTAPLDLLARNWQHQVLSNLLAKEHLGVLIGAPLTDVRITLIGGRAHIKHSEGGDFREATWRAVRQGLMELRARGAVQLLEPWYDFRLEVPATAVGHALTDIERMHGTFAVADAGTHASVAVITGTAPVATMQSYAQELRTYTHGQGQLECIVAGYRPCHDADAVVAATAYEPVADLENTPDSVFCSHGAGYPVPWEEVPGMAHVGIKK